MNTPLRFWRNLSRHAHPAHILALSFLALILIGTLLLTLPVSKLDPDARVVDALFISTSAACVTGLTSVNITTTYSFFGNVVILLLIQLGGLGIITFSTFFAYILAGRLSMRGRDLIENSISSQPAPYLGRLLKFAVVGTLLIEGLGTLILTLRFSQDYPFGQALWIGLFHAVSAFCNAGFSTFTHNLAGHATDVTVNLTIMTLIVIGGLGFWVLHDLFFWRPGGHKHLSLHSKIALSMTGLLILIGACLLLFFEQENSMRSYGVGGKLLASFFQSITARTAGFNTLPIGDLTNGALVVLTLFMAIGASPGSTGGGIKTTTFAIILVSFFTRLRSQEQVRIFNRGIPESIVTKAIGISFFWFMTIAVATLLMSVTEARPASDPLALRTLVEIVFEAFSALGTVGLSMGITPRLSAAGKIICVLLMYIGRIGPVTLALSIAAHRSLPIRYVEENVIVG
ncbi:MAG TPA: TrkH family potassium uptake protein [bacterium]|nr:TrkH family potassium uptake protein [bacterium]HQG45353.1 TrkH family potassium uptake protein [bacterium]HQI48029.1 TrkH family potassium uptake protein [bacterium]HQJ63591.1 TrkH family potassium uptake protein [bacterium]